MIFGLVSVLKELKGCRIVIIYNENELSEKDLDEIQRYREKIVDVEVTYEPKIEDNVNLILKNHPYCSVFTETFNKMNINNIRIMQHAKWCAEYFLPHIEDLESLLINEFLYHSIMISCFYHDKSLSVDLNSLTLNSYTILWDEKDKDERRKDAARKLLELGYYQKEYDAFIIEYLKHGKCNLSELTSLMKKQSHDVKRMRVNEDNKKLWSLYKANFQVNQKELVSKFTDFMDKQCQYLYPAEFNHMIEMLSDLGLSKKAIEWEVIYWKHNCSALDSMQVLEELKRKCLSSKTKEIFMSRLSEIKSKHKINDLIKSITINKSWGEETFNILNSFSDKEYEKWIAESEDPDLLKDLHSFYILFSRRTEPEGAEKDVLNKIKKALVKISKINRLNYIRVKNLFPGLIAER